MKFMSRRLASRVEGEGSEFLQVLEPKGESPINSLSDLFPMIREIEKVIADSPASVWRPAFPWAPLGIVGEHWRIFCKRCIPDQFASNVWMKTWNLSFQITSSWP